MLTKQFLELRKFCVEVSESICLRAMEHPTINDVINQSKRLEEYMTLEDKGTTSTSDAEVEDAS